MMPKLILCAVYCGAALVIMLLQWPLICRKIPPNSFYGFRVKKTMQDPEVWYAVNVVAGKRFAAAGFFIIVGAIAFYFIPNWRLEHYSLSCLLVTLFSVGYALIESIRFLRNYKKESPSKSE
jgi:uncharacterized membrane protein